MKKLFCLSLLLAAFGAVTAAAQSTSSHRLGIAYSSSLFSNKERFEFSIGTETVILSSANPTVYFRKTFTPNESFRVSQVSGPRSCTFLDPATGTFGDQDRVLLANCGNPPLSIFKLEVTGIVQGETFKFADNYGRSVSLPFSTTMNLGGFPQGDDYVLTQRDGPRQCRMTLNQGTVPATPVTIKADCAGGTPEPPTTGSPKFNSFDMITRSADDKILGTFFETFTPVIGGTGADEGRFVAYVTYTKGLGGGSGKYRQVVWRDRKTGETRLVSQGMNNVEGNQNSGAPAISADGKSVAFESYATNLVPVDSNGVRDIFVWNADTNRITAVNENRGIETNAESSEPAISADGNLIAFTSSADNLAPGVNGTSTPNVFLRDMRSGSVTLISKDEKTGKAGGGSRPSISEDGSRIAFYNYFPLTKEDKNNLWDIYVWEAGKLRRVSKTAGGGERNQGDESTSRVVAPTISGDGRFVAFSTTANNVAGEDGGKFQDVFLTEIDSGRVVRVSTSEGNNSPDGDAPIGQGERIALSYDGSLVVFSTKAKNLGGNVVMKEVRGNKITAISADPDSSVGQPEMTRTGKAVIFGTNRRLDKRFQSSGIFVAYFDPAAR